MTYYSISEKLNPNRNLKEPSIFIGENSVNRISIYPYSAKPGETLFIVPKLAENLIIPKSINLLFNLNISGHQNNTVINNIGRNLVKRLKIMFEGETVQNTQRYDLFQTYHDFIFLPNKIPNNKLK